MLLLAMCIANGAPIDVWERDDFGHRTGVAGTDDWENGYAADTWWGEDGYVVSATDHNIGDSGGDAYGSGWAADNWLIRGEKVLDGGVSAGAFNEDDDTIGLVFAHNGIDSFYLAIHTRGSSPPPIDNVDQPTAIILRMEDGNPMELGRGPADLHDGINNFSLEFNDGDIRFVVNGDTVVTANDANPLAAGKAGFFSYDAGYDNDSWQNTNAGFDDIVVYQFDEDDDGIPDDIDDCEFDVDCDEDEDPADDTDVDASHDDGDASGNSIHTEGLGVGTCGCQTSTVTGWMWLILLPIVSRKRQ
jgi:hypothetical protein